MIILQLGYVALFISILHFHPDNQRQRHRLDIMSERSNRFITIYDNCSCKSSRFAANLIWARVKNMPVNKNRTTLFIEGNLLFSLLVALCAAIVAPACQANTAQSQYLSINSAELLLSSEATPLLQDQGWQSVTLPDAWPVERYQTSDNGWYRISVPRAAPDELWGVYLPKLNMNAAVYFNGHYLGGGGSFDEPLGRNWSRPLYFAIPESLWQSEENQIMIRLKSYYGFGALGNIYIGPDSRLKAEYQQRHFWKISVSIAVFLLLQVIALFMFSMWRHRRQDSMYLWFALTTFTWSFFSLNKFIAEIPVSEKLWDGAIYSIIAWWGVFLPLFCLRIAQIEAPRMEKTLYIFGAAATACYLSSDIESFPNTVLVWQLGIFIIGVTTLIKLILKWRETPTSTVALVAAGIAIIVVVGAYDALTQSSIIPLKYQIFTHVLDLSSSIMLLIIAWHLTKRFIHALNESEALTQELETRVSVKSAELEQSYKKLAELEKQQAVTMERERIHRDLHDDVGAKLLSLTYRSKDDTSYELARSALQDLRDVVSRASCKDLNLIDALADWRAETDERLDGAQITLHWQQSDKLPDHLLQARQTMNIGRILREAISNILRHAEAKNVYINVDNKNENILISIENDGCAPELSILQTGRGTQNMKARAALLGGDIYWESRQPNGCFIGWWFPVTLPETS